MATLDAEEKMTKLTDDIHALFRGYVNGCYAHKEKHLELERKMKIILNYCKPYMNQMWASKVVSVILDCDFKDAESELRKICES